MHHELPAGLRQPSRVLGSLNGQHHVTDGALHQVKSYGFFVHTGGAVVSALVLDPSVNTGDITFLNGVTLEENTEWIIPGILSITLTSGGVSLFADGKPA